MRNYVGTCQRICSYHLVYNSLIQLLPLQCSVFLIHFSNVFWHGNEVFPKGSSQNEIVPCTLSFVIQLIQGCENMFSLVPLSKSTFFTRIALASFVSHSCRLCCKIEQIVPSSVVQTAFLRYLENICNTRFFIRKFFLRK